MIKNQKDIELTSNKDTSIRSSLMQPPLDQHPIIPTRKKIKNKRIQYHQIQDDREENQKDVEEGKNSNKINNEKRKFSWPIWKKLFEYSLKRKFHLLLGLILNLAFAMSISLLPLQVGKVLDSITNTSEQQTTNNINFLKENVYQLGIMTLLLAMFVFTRLLSMLFIQEFLAMDMRNDFFKRFIENDIHFFEQYKSGQLVSRLSSDVNQAKSAISNNVTYFLRSCVLVISNIIILFTINFKLTLLVILLVPIYCFITCQYSKRNKLLVRAHQDVQAQISAAVTQKFSGIQLIKAYSTEQTEIENYGQIILKGYQINRKKIFLTATYNSLSEFLPYLGIMGVLWYGGQMVINGSTELTAGQLTSFILYCTSLANSTSAIANSYTNIVNGTYAVQKVFEMLEYKPLVDEKTGENYTISGEIQFRNVTFKYPASNTVALKDISFSIREGEYIAFVGESGSGKSTIIKLIQKFYPIESGEIYYGPHAQSDINAICMRKQIGLVNQDATLFSGTIQDNITYGLVDYSLEEMEEAAERAGCLEFLNNPERFPKKFLSQVGEKGNNLSGGQKQRISIARALMRKPKIIIFDQATSALDSNSQRMVQESIESLAKDNLTDNKPTIIVIAHRLSTIMNANRIFVMKDGEIIEEGSHRQLLQQQGYYYQLIEKQLGDSAKKNFSPESGKNERKSA